MKKTSIEYLTHTWNPIAMRCTPESEGCAHCWHLRLADRLSKNPVISEEKRCAYAGGPPIIEPNVRLNIVLKRKRHAVVGVQFMGDLFHENIPFEWILRIFGRMNAAHWHTFIVITKRPERALAFCREYGLAPDPTLGGRTGSGETWPANVWFLVTAENQKWASIRIPIALQIPAPVIGVSVEPMLGPVEFDYPAMEPTDCRIPGDTTPMIDWVICGGESGPGARPMHPDWVRSLRDQCVEAGVPFYFKQWGEWGLNWLNDDCGKIEGSEWMDKMGKKAAGRMLDGRTWEQMPGA